MSQDGTSVMLGEIIREFGLEVLHAGTDYLNTPLCTLDVNRPGLPLAGFFEHFDSQRLLVIGLTETDFLADMTPERRHEIFNRLFSYPIPALIITRGLEPTPECLEQAQEHDRTLLRTAVRTSTIISSLIGSLTRHLSPRITRSGVMLEIYGEGVLIQGESGVGKSEVAMELIKRGHRIISDDAVDIQQTGPGVLLASSPELIRHYMELRGIGVVDVRQLFGMGAIKLEQQIDLVITLETWKDGAVYDRLGLDGSFTHILGVKLPAMTIPVKPGRNLASIVEVAAMNNRCRKTGHNAALELTRRMDEHFAKQMGGNS